MGLVSSESRTASSKIHSSEVDSESEWRARNRRKWVGFWLNSWRYSRSASTPLLDSVSEEKRSEAYSYPVSHDSWFFSRLLRLLSLLLTLTLAETTWLLEGYHSIPRRPFRLVRSWSPSRICSQFDMLSAVKVRVDSPSRNKSRWFQLALLKTLNFSFLKFKDAEPL